jgi:hypothetical protein
MASHPISSRGFLLTQCVSTRPLNREGCDEIETHVVKATARLVNDLMSRGLALACFNTDILTMAILAFAQDTSKPQQTKIEGIELVDDSLRLKIGGLKDIDGLQYQIFDNGAHGVSSWQKDNPPHESQMKMLVTNCSSGEYRDLRITPDLHIERYHYPEKGRLLSGVSSLFINQDLSTTVRSLEFIPQLKEFHPVVIEKFTPLNELTSTEVFGYDDESKAMVGSKV